MLRLSESALVLLPVALLLAWLALGRLSRWAIGLGCGAMAVLAALTIAYGLERRLDRSDVYVPARLEEGRIVDGHGVPPAVR